MGRDNNTYAKRQREMEKKRKAQDKRARRQNRKAEAASGGSGHPENASREEI